jgi:membrane protein implicated in regulation of membrane protease activity
MTPYFALFESFTWWAHLTGAQQFFYGIGIAAGAVTLVLVVLTVIGLDHHDADFSGGHDGSAAEHGDGSSLLSTKPITGFFLGFGWGGGIALDHGLSLALATVIAAANGVVLMMLLAWAIKLIYSFRTDGTRKINDAIGAIGTVYVTLPPSRASGGQINVTFSGRLETVAALNAALRAVPSGEKVKVVGVIDTNTVLVEPLG